MVAGTVAIDGQPFAAEFIAEHVSGADIFPGGEGRQVDGLADRGVDPIFLKDTLHADVLFRADILGGPENFLPVFGDLAMTDDRAC